MRRVKQVLLWVGMPVIAIALVAGLYALGSGTARQVSCLSGLKSPMGDAHWAEMSLGGPEQADYEFADEAVDASVADEAVSRAGAVYADTVRKLIRTADVQIETEDARRAMKQAQEMAKKAGGFVADTQMSRYDDGSYHCSVTIRVPVEEFEGTLKAAEQLGRVTEVSSGTQDVTSEYVDLEARLRNAKREEEELLKLLAKGGKLADIIEVQSKLFEVRERVERFEGQVRVLKEQVQLSTITLRLYERGEAAVAEIQEYDFSYHLRSASRALVAVLRGLLTFAVYFVLVGWVVWLPLLLIRLWIRRRRRSALGDAGASGQKQTPEA